MDTDISHLRYNGTILNFLRPYELWYGRTKNSNLGWKLNAEFIMSMDGMLVSFKLVVKEKQKERLTCLFDAVSSVLCYYGDNIAAKAGNEASTHDGTPMVCGNRK
eukprot:8815691-Ditylum_brightwellii.AAC.1